MTQPLTSAQQGDEMFQKDEECRSVMKLNTWHIPGESTSVSRSAESERSAKVKDVRIYA